MFDTLERGLHWLSSFALHGDVDSYCQLDHCLDDHTFVTSTGSLLTLYQLVGSRRLIGTDEFQSQSLALSGVLAKFLRAGYGGKQHSVLFGFRSDKDSGRDRAIELLDPSVKTAKRFGADSDWVFGDRLDAIAKHVIDEVAVFGVLTHRAGFTPAELERAVEDTVERRAKLRKSGEKLSHHTQMSTMGPVSLLVSRHNATLATIEDAISNPGGRVKVMLQRQTCHQASRLMKRFLEAGPVGSNWRPQLMGDKPSGMVNSRDGEAKTIAMPKRLSRQIVSEKLTAVFSDAEMVKKGVFHYGSLVLDILPQEDVTPSFSELASSIGGEVPWQVHFQIAPNGMTFKQLEKFFSSVFGAAGDHNKRIKAAWDELRHLQADGEYIAALRTVFTTWSKESKKCVDNLAFLRSKIESWGQTVVTNETAAPSAAFLASSPGFSGQMPADFLPGPISNLSRMMPAFRPSSVWNAGQMLLHTKEGRPYPIALGSTLQNYWGTLLLAPTGYGKSFLLNMFNTGAAFSPGLTELPLITIIDKGPSAKGMLDLLKAMLPPHLAAQCAYLRPTQGDASFTCNPLDTQLGCDKPMASDKDFCNALLSTMAPNLGPEGGKFVNKVIEVLYDYFDRRSPTARKWQPGMNPKLHQLLPRIGINYNESAPPRVWNIVDAFFDAGLVDEATEAQLHAVPTLPDINSVINSDTRIKSEYAGAKIGDEPIVNVFLRNITSAMGQYKLFCGVSRFKGAERIMVIDTEGLAASSSSEEGKRVYAVSLLFARRLGARNFFIHPTDIADITPPRYAAWHKLRAQKIREQLKFLEYDEIHNARGIGAVQELLQKDAREGRKYNIVCILSSQELDDFPKELVNNSYNFFILGAGTGTAAREIQNRFDLSDSEISALLRECTGPGKFFAMFKTEKGTLSQILYSRPGPIEMWAYSTSANDTAVRDALYLKFGTKRTLQFLAKEFPGGSARPMIEKMRLQMGEDASDDGITQAILGNLMPKAISAAA